MSDIKLPGILAASLKSSVALLPLAIAFAQMPAGAQTPAPKTQQQLEAEAAAAKAAAASADSDDAAAIADLTSGLTGASTTRDTNARDIIVTGTNIRGVAPTGTSVTVLPAEDIAATGQASGTQMLAQIPQFNTFNTLPQITMGAVNGYTNVINARGTYSDNTDSGGNTLVLVDGNRTSGVGARVNVQDADGIPVSLLERVEINTDGASSVYGSDAIGGVVNFVTRRKFDGVQVTGKYSFRDEARGYGAWDLNGIVGKDWGSGSAYVSYGRSWNSTVLNGDISWYLPRVAVDPVTGLETGTACDPPNIQITASGSGPTATVTHFYRVDADGNVVRTGTTPPAGGTVDGTVGANNINRCTNALLGGRLPATKRNNVLVNFAQDFGDSIRLTVRGRYSDNHSETVSAPSTGSVGIRPNNPFYQDLVGSTGNPATFPTATPGQTQNDAGRVQVVQFSYLPVQDLIPAAGRWEAGRLPYGLNKFHQYGANAELVWNVDGNWQAKFYAGWDQSKSFSGGRSIFSANVTQATQGTTSATLTACEIASRDWFNLPAGAAKNTALAVAKTKCINPYNIESSDPSLFGPIFNGESSTNSKDKIYDFKVNLEGSLFEIPGGKVRVAVGGEYLSNSWGRQGPLGGGQIGGLETLPYPTVTRNNWSAYGEVNIPLVSSANAMDFVKELRLSLSARYDEYTVAGGTFNPRVGANYKPFNWLTIRGAYSTNFRAPTAVDLLGLGFVPLSVVGQGFANGNATIAPDSFGLIHPTNTDNQNPPGLGWVRPLQLTYNGGTVADIKPQTGKNWSVGVEVTPFRGFRASVSYWDILYKDRLSTPQGSGGPATFPDLYMFYPCGTDGNCNAAELAVINEFLSLTDQPDVLDGSVALQSGQIYSLVDGRRRNLGNNHTAGIDYSFRYNSRTGFGSVFAQVSGTIKRVDETQVNDLSPWVNRLHQASQGASTSTHTLSGSAGFAYNTNIGTLNVRGILQHSGGYFTTFVEGRGNRVDNYDVVNAFVTFDFTGDSFLERDLQLSLNVNNVLNSPPPFRGGGANTLGRVIVLGFSKKF